MNSNDRQQAEIDVELFRFAFERGMRFTADEMDIDPDSHPTANAVKYMTLAIEDYKAKQAECENNEQ